jgi:hypothetical protein
MDEKDIWRTAALLIKQHGRKAGELAKLRAIDMMEKKDANGEAAWKRIAQAVDDLTKTRGGEAVH